MPTLMSFFMRNGQNRAQIERDKALGQYNTEERNQNCQNVYDTILLYGKLTSKEIEKKLEMWHHHLSVKTIQRCIKDDHRIIKNKRYYSIDENARFETRYRDPKKFGLQLYYDMILDSKFLGREVGYDPTTFQKLATIFGAIIMFVFIESSRPFQDKVKGRGKDKGTMTRRYGYGYKDRRQLVDYWANNAIPVELMFRVFTNIFTRRMTEIMRHKPPITAKDLPIEEIENEIEIENKPDNEMTEKQVYECLQMLEESYPEIYKELIDSRKKFMSKIKTPNQ
jgi:hypothetical protein